MREGRSREERPQRSAMEGKQEAAFIPKKWEVAIVQVREDGTSTGVAPGAH